MDVRTDHRIVSFGDDRMMLSDAEQGAVIADANRPGLGQQWTIVADGVPDVTAADRPLAITAMIEQALASLPGQVILALFRMVFMEMPFKLNVKP